VNRYKYTPIALGDFFNPNCALEAKRTNSPRGEATGALVGFNPDLKIQNSDLATLGFHQKGFLWFCENLSVD